MSLHDLIDSLIERRRASNRLRILPKQTGNGVDLYSNDYLGLSTSGRLMKAFRLELDQYNEVLCGSTGSRLLSGNTKLVEQFETKLKEIHGGGSATIFCSGYDANIGVIAALGHERRVCFFFDELIHASMRDAFRLSFGKSRKFPHNDVEELDRLLKQHDGPAVVCVESVYSMDGDTAPLKEIADLASHHGAALLVDEAHATGVFGRGGRGLVDELKLTEQIDIRVHTWGKALGCQGAVVVGPPNLQDLLSNYARSFIYSTGISAPLLLAAKAAYGLLLSAEKEREDLNTVINQWNRGAGAFGDQVTNNLSPIQSVLVPGENKVKAAAAKLQEKGFMSLPVVSPTVPVGTERLRISLHAHNSASEIEGVQQLLQEILQ